MSLARRRKDRTDSAEYSDASYEDGNHINSGDDDDGDSEYGSADNSGSDLSERESGDGQATPGSGQKSERVDDDEDRRNPQYIPKRGTFYEHDDRTAPGEEESTEAPEGTPAVRTEGSDAVPRSGEVPPSGTERKPRQTRSTATDKWSHDKFNENDQAPKSSEELIAIYGYDIRGEEGPPRAFRRRKYGRGPAKYTRNWEDEQAYGGNKGAPRSGTPRSPPQVGNGEEFPALQSNNDRNRRDKPRNGTESTSPSDSPKKSIELEVKPAAELDRNANDRALPGTARSSEAQRPSPRQRLATGRGPPVGQPPRRPWAENKNVENARTEPAQKEPASPAGAHRALPVPPVSAGLPSASLGGSLEKRERAQALRKPHQSHVPPRLQQPASAGGEPERPPRATRETREARETAESTGGGGRAGAGGSKRYSSIRQRPMPEAYQPQQIQYIPDYQQPPPSQQAQQSIQQTPQPPITAALPHRQTPPPLLQQHQQQQQQIQQIHQPPLQLHQTNAVQMHQSSPSLLQTNQHQSPAAMHQNPAMLQQSQQPLLQTNPALLQSNQQMHQSANLHQTNAALHQGNPALHQVPHQTTQAMMLQANPQVIQTNPTMHQPSSVLHQTNPPLHQPSPTLHQQNPPIHQANPPTLHQSNPPMHQPTVALHQTNPPIHQSSGMHQVSPPLQTQLSRQAAGTTVPQMPLRQVQRPHQQIPIHSMPAPTHLQPGLVATQSYAPPPQPMMPQPQYIQSTNGAMFSHTLPPQVYQPQPGYPAPPPPIPYHHQPAPTYAPPPHVNTGRSVYREPSGITFYSPQEQKGLPLPTRRPTNAIPIVPPPSRGRGRLTDAAAAQKDNIDHIVDNMFVPRHQPRTGPSRPGETPRAVDTSAIMGELTGKPEDRSRESLDKSSKESSHELSPPRVEATPLSEQFMAVVEEPLTDSVEKISVAEDEPPREGSPADSLANEISERLKIEADTKAEECLTTVDLIDVPAVIDEPTVTGVAEPPAALAVERPVSPAVAISTEIVVDTLITTPVRKLPAACEVELPIPSSVELPSTPVKELPITSEVESLVAELPARPEVEIFTTPVVEVPATPVVESPAMPVVQLPSTPVVELPALVIVELPTTVTEVKKELVQEIAETYLEDSQDPPLEEDVRVEAVQEEVEINKEPVVVESETIKDVEELVVEAKVEESKVDVFTVEAVPIGDSSIIQKDVEDKVKEEKTEVAPNMETEEAEESLAVEPATAVN